jgi:hypothetical protein
MGLICKVKYLGRKGFQWASLDRSEIVPTVLQWFPLPYYNFFDKELYIFKEGSLV